MTLGPWVFNGLDIAVLVLCLISLLMAASRGFKRELISILALVIGGIASLIIWGQFRIQAQEIINNDRLSDIVLGAGSFSLAYILVVFFLGKMLNEDGKPSLINRLLGGAFGALRGLVLAALVVMYFTADYRDARDWSDVYAFIEANPDSITPELMEKLEEKFGAELDQEAPELPAFYANSELYPVLEKIGNVIRAIPFSRLKSVAERLKDGDLDLDAIMKDLENDPE